MSKKYNTLGEWAKDTCDAIRSKDGTSDPIAHGDIPDRIKAITTGSDVAGVTATPADVSENVKFVDSGGTLRSGTMPEITATETTLDSTTTEVTIPAGHHNGTGKVKIVPDTNNTFTPATTKQEFTPASGKVYTKVIIGASEAVDLSGVTASASDVLSGKKFMSSGGVLTDGTMRNNGVLNGSKSGSGTYTLTEGYYGSGSKITVTNATYYQDNSSGTTARAEHILEGKTCRSNGVSVTGTIKTSSASGTTITPNASGYSILGDRYLSSDLKIAGDTNLVAGNIKSGVSIFGVTGTYAGSSDGKKYVTSTVSRTSISSGESAILLPSDVSNIELVFLIDNSDTIFIGVTVALSAMISFSDNDVSGCRVVTSDGDITYGSAGFTYVGGYLIFEDDAYSCAAQYAVTVIGT